MPTITVEEIDGKLKTLSEDKLAAVYHFVSYLAERDFEMSDISAKDLMLASENLIARDWDTPEEDKAWADL
jgi:hypothetical protein